VDVDVLVGVYDGVAVEVGVNVYVLVAVNVGVLEGVRVDVGVDEGVGVEVGVKVFVAVGVNDNAAIASCARAVRAIEVNVEFTVLVGEGVVLGVNVCVGGTV